MKQIKFILLTVILIAIFSCNQNTTPPTKSETNITSLQTVISNASDGDTIDLSQSQYSSITEYSATIDKALTISNGSNLDGATLIITTDGVSLSGLTNLNVTTSASTKISSSTLSSLNISTEAVANSRGDKTASNAPTVLVDQSTVSDICINIDNAVLAVGDITTDNINIKSDNAQLSIKDTTSTVKNITTDKVCTIVLEAGSSNNIATPTVTGNGELTQVNLQSEDPASLALLGLDTIFEKNTPIDKLLQSLTNVKVYALYTDSKGVTSFKANGCSFDLTQDVGIYINNFSIKLDEKPLTEIKEIDLGEHSLKITSGSSSVTYNILVVESLNDLNPTNLTVDKQTAKTEYNVGDKLDLNGLTVKATYTINNEDYEVGVANYDLSVANGTVLDATNSTVTVSYKDLTANVGLTINASVTVTYVVDKDNNILIVKTIKSGGNADYLNVYLEGKTFNGWLDESSKPFDFNTSINNNITLTANWSGKTYTITFHGNGGVYSNGDKEPLETYSQDCTFDLSVDLEECKFTRNGYTFKGWSRDTTSNIATFQNKQTVTNLATENNATVNLYAVWQENTYTIIFEKGDYNAEGETCPITIKYSETLTMPVCGFTLKNATFVSWTTNSGTTGYKTNDECNMAQLSQYADSNNTITFKAQWSVQQGQSFVKDDGTIVINGTEFNNTSMAKAMSDAPITITGDDSSWSVYCKNSVDPIFKGVFVAGRNITLSKFEIGQYEVTQQLYNAVMGIDNTTDEGGSRYQYGSGDTYPAYNINWYQAIAFCNKLSSIMGFDLVYTVSTISDWANLTYNAIPTDSNATWEDVSVDLNKNGYRLPTEAEWEFAARGGNTADYNWKCAFSGTQTVNNSKILSVDHTNDAALNQYAWYLANTQDQVGYTRQTGTKNHNRLVVSDMCGNVSEWCWDIYDNLAIGDLTNPTGPTYKDSDPETQTQSNVLHILRGGSASSNAYECAVSYRKALTSIPNQNDSKLNGIRLVRTVK